jgi:ABC-type transporter MlaC component
MQAVLHVDPQQLKMIRLSMMISSAGHNSAAQSVLGQVWRQQQQQQQYC